MIDINQIYTQILKNIIRKEYGIELEKDFDKIRKETAREILTCVKELVIKYRGVGCGVHPLVFDLEELAKQYGVEVE